MEYKYRVFDEVYNEMLSGHKTVEFRLLNEKSDSIKIGDTIKFIVLNNDNKYLVTKVIGKYIYNDINELCNSEEIKNNSLNYSKEKIIETFNGLYGEETVKKSKFVGFKIEVIVK